MKIAYHKQFVKHFKQRIIPHPSFDRQYKRKLKLFQEDRGHPFLADHPLHGDMEGYRSFSITGDIRVVYRIEGNVFHFYDIGTHNQVY